MKNILVTSTGSVATDITFKSLKRMGFRVIGCNIYPKEWIVESGDMDEFYQVPPVSKSEEYLTCIKGICIKESIDFLIPMIDYEIDLLNNEREWFTEQGIVLCISPKESIDIIRNKKVFQDFIIRNCPNIKGIPTLYVKDVKELEWDFPVVCKPYDGRSSHGLKYIYNQYEWDEFVANNKNEKYIVEPFIEGPLVMVEVVRQNTPEKTVAMTRREILSTPNGCSLTVYIYQDRLLEENTIDLANKLGVLGDVNFEYILDKEGVYHLVECNPRFSAGCEFSCMGGYDCIENHMKCFQGKSIEDYHFKHSMIIARKYEEYITVVDTTIDWFNTIH